MAAASGMADSDVASASYTIQQPVATPTFSPPGGTYTEFGHGRHSAAQTSGATIYYTTDGTHADDVVGRLHRSDPDRRRPRRSRRWPRRAGWPTATWRAPRTRSSSRSRRRRSARRTARTRSSVTVALSTPDQWRDDLLHDRRHAHRRRRRRSIRIRSRSRRPRRSRRWPRPTGWPTAPQPAPRTRFSSRLRRRRSASRTGTYSCPVAVTITIGNATSGATIHYTTDGTTPTTSSPIYTGPIFIKATTTIRAMAASSGMANSDVASASYTIRVAPPGRVLRAGGALPGQGRARRQGDDECRRPWLRSSSPSGS